MGAWRKCVLADLGEIVGGATPSTKIESYYGGTIAWITPKDLSVQKSRYVSRGERNITNEGLMSCSARVMPKYSVLFTSRAPIGYVAIAKNEVCTNQGFKSIVPNANTDPLFLYYLLVHSKDKIEALGTGTTFKEVSAAAMRQVSVLVPRLDEQQKISRILSSLDDKIERNNELNHNLEQAAQVLFEQLLIKDCSGEPVGKLSDIAELNPVRNLSRGATAIYIEMSNLSTDGSFPLDWTTRPFAGGMKFTNGDTIMARITPCLENGKTAYINFLDDGEVAFGSTEYIIISPKLGYCSEMFYFLARNSDFVSYAVGNMNGTSGRQRVSGSTIGNYSLHIPPSSKVNDFENAAKPILDSIRSNAIDSRKLAQLREALLPRLISGELSAV